eukprot:TRINITY_DN33641_c0_g1_i1.p1 TRINITY_DN33641_c0_g1~~TRINITY_DN33641_c0_g1_i1.p1  ORF type:complete len:213 (+),score=46.55 TRINITY_DN33641_c0_g1_i1:224-862(+)
MAEAMLPEASVSPAATVSTETPTRQPQPLARAADDLAEAFLKVRQQVDSVMTMCGPYMKSHFSPLRPWNEFFFAVSLDASFDIHDLQVRVEANLSYFQANYLSVAAVIFGVALLVHPAWLWAVSLVAGGWAVYVSNGGLDPAWKPQVGGIQLMSSHRLMILYIGSLTFLFLTFGEALLVLVGAVAMLTFAHAGLHAGAGVAAVAASVGFAAV